MSLNCFRSLKRKVFSGVHRLPFSPTTFIGSLPSFTSPTTKLSHLLSLVATMNNPPNVIDQLITQTEALNWSDNPPLLTPDPKISSVDSPCTLVGRVISLHSITKTIVRNNLKTAWSFLPSFVIEETEEVSTFTFTFNNPSEAQKIQDLSPWNIKGNPLILKTWEAGSTLIEIDFSKGAYWIQVHGLPIELITS